MKTKAIIEVFFTNQDMIVIELHYKTEAYDPHDFVATCSRDVKFIDLSQYFSDEIFEKSKIQYGQVPAKELYINPKDIVAIKYETKDI